MSGWNEKREIMEVGKEKREKGNKGGKERR